jgi:hypothetical protein
VTPVAPRHSRVHCEDGYRTGCRGTAVDGPVERHDQPDAARPDELRDTALHEEIELVGQLVVAATSTPDRLSQEEIDKVLGVEPED